MPALQSVKEQALPQGLRGGAALLRQDRQPAAGRRGIEYSAYGYQDFLKAKGIVPSMNRPRNCRDNAHMESFFHSLKADLTHHRNYASDAALNASVAGCIDRFYNQKRIHSSLGYHSPVEFECSAHA